MPHRNRLAHELSPYLLQHASNPVDWHPWGEEAFERARAEDKPIFLSIGYSTCHWCHVMEHESFEDPEVADLLNRSFVSIKVDREERPDVDQVYMSVCQMLTGSGGWPLTVLMTPDKRPFWAGTYVPKHGRFGRPGMVELLPRVAELWTSSRDRLVHSANEIVGHLQSSASAGGAGEIPDDLAGHALQQLASRFDSRYGGFGQAPKFPSPHNLLFLIQHWRLTGRREALEMVDLTLRQMRSGGIWDHVGCGFHRYSTDREWLLPHFEKMLYDQAMLALAAVEAWRATGDRVHRRTAVEILEYVLRDMTSPDGGFYSAEDADSEGEEGRFYVWSRAELSEVLTADQLELVEQVWGVSSEGNFHDEASGAATGANILHFERPPAEVAPDLGISPDELDRRLEAVRARLFEIRERRVHPLKDDKILADWNGLMAAAMARAGAVLDEPRYLRAAADAVEFVWTRMRTPDGGLLHRYRAGDAAIAAFLDDHAFLVWALLELYDATLDPVHLERAFALQKAQDRFRASDGSFYFTADDGEPMLVRQREIYDGAIPSGNSVSSGNLLRLARLTGRPELEHQALAIAAAAARDLDRLPSGHSHLVAAVERAGARSTEVVVVGARSDPDTRSLLAVVRRSAPPGSVTLLVEPGAAGDRARRLAPFVDAMTLIEGKAAAYVCHGFACELPTTDPDRLTELLFASPDGG